jgi:hypothetical protein
VRLEKLALVTMDPVNHVRLVNTVKVVTQTQKVARSAQKATLKTSKDKHHAFHAFLLSIRIKLVNQPVRIAPRTLRPMMRAEENHAILVPKAKLQNLAA